jgi:hypothetical protein
VPVLIGEIGAANGNPIELATFKNSLTCLNQWNMSYLVFTWKPNSLWNVLNYPMSNPVLTETGVAFIQKVMETP